MEQQNYRTSILVNAPVQEAFESISKGVPEWWATNFEGSGENLGDVFTVHFGKTFVTFKVKEMIPNQRIVWFVEDCHLPFVKDVKEWQYNEVVWDFKPEGDQTCISMEHVGLHPGVECFEGCNAGWNKHIQHSLVSLLTEGVGQPQG